MVEDVVKYLAHEWDLQPNIPNGVNEGAPDIEPQPEPEQME